MADPQPTTQVRVEPITNADDFSRCFAIAAAACMFMLFLDSFVRKASKNLSHDSMVTDGVFESITY